MIRKKLRLNFNSLLDYNYPQKLLSILKHSSKNGYIDTTNNCNKTNNVFYARNITTEVKLITNFGISMKCIIKKKLRITWDEINLEGTLKGSNIIELSKSYIASMFIPVYIILKEEGVKYIYI